MKKRMAYFFRAIILSFLLFQTQDPRSQSLRAQVREFELAYASVFFKNFLLREIHKANFRRDVIYTFSSFKDGEAFENIRDFEFFSWI